MHQNSELQLSLLSNFSNVITFRLDDTNYVTWRFMLESMLVGCALMGYIDGSIPCPPQYKSTKEGCISSELTQDFKDWRKNDSALITLLAATLSSDALSFIVGSKTSKEVWFSLEQRYGKLSKYKAFELKTSMQKIQKGNDSIDKYMQRFKTVRDQLSVAGVSIPDEDIVILILNGLPSEFATMKTIIRIKTQKSPISMEELRSLLLIAEDEINQSVKSISLSLEAAMAAFDDNSKGTLPSHSLNNSLPNSEMVSSSTTPAATISNTTALTSNSSKPVTQFGCVPQPTVISTTLGYVSASTPATSTVRASNTMMCTSSVAPPTGCTMQYMPNSEYMMSAAPAALNGCIIYHSPSPYMFNVQPQDVGYSPYNNGLVQSQVCTEFTQPNGSISIQHNGGFIEPHGTFSCQNGDFHTNDSFLQQAPDNSRQSNDSCGQDKNNGVYGQRNKSSSDGGRIDPFVHNNEVSQARSSDSQSVCTGKICQICKRFGHIAGTCPQRSAPRQIIASGSYMQCQICMKSGHSAAECLYRHNYTFQPPNYVSDASQSLPLHINNATPAPSDLSKWQQELLKEIEAFPIQGTWRLFSTPLEQTTLHCRQATYPIKLCQSLPLINPG